MRKHRMNLAPSANLALTGHMLNRVKPEVANKSLIERDEEEKIQLSNTAANLHAKNGAIPSTRATDKKIRQEVNETKQKYKL